MATVKTYQNINSREEDVSFGISRMEDIYTRRNGRIDEPHRHSFYTVLIIKKARGFHKIDFNTFDLASQQIFFVAPGQVHQVVETEKSMGFVMTFSSRFLVESSIPVSFIESLNLFQNYGFSPPLMPGSGQFNRIEGYADQIYSLFLSQAAMKELSIGAFLKLLLIECNNSCAMNPIASDKPDAGTELIRKFRSHIESDFKKEHSTGHYAAQLHITPDHLTRTVKNKIGKTAKEYIQSRIITEAKRLLYFTNLSNKEIGYELGFNEPANFSAFFKKHTLLSPSDFKKKEQKS